MNTIKVYWKQTGACFVLLLLLSCERPSAVTETPHHADESEGAVELSDGQMKNAGVLLGEAKQRPISGAIRASGLLDVPPQQVVSVSVPFGGFLKMTPLLQGSKVRRGQLIAVIENPDYIQFQQDYLEAVNQVEFTKADHERQMRLAEDNVNAQKTLQQSKSVYKSWLAKRNGLQAKLKMLNLDVASVEEGNITSTANVYSALDGFVTEINANIGKFVNPADVLFEIVNTEHLHAELTIFEKDIPKIKIGQKVRFTLANESSERTATVYLIGRQISDDRTIRIHCHIDREDTNLLPGMYLQATVEAGEILVNALPDEAIVDFQNKKYVFVGDGSPSSGESNTEGSGRRFMMIEIRTGNSESGFTEVSLPDSLSASSLIVVQGAYAILSKLKNSEEEGHDH